MQQAYITHHIEDIISTGQNKTSSISFLGGSSSSKHSRYVIDNNVIPDINT